jgi:peptidyl-prolyl cis-trans isomerase SurA
VATAPPDEAVVALTQLVFPAANAQELAASQQLAETARRSVGDCAGLAALARELRIAPPAEAQRLRVADVNPSIRDTVRQLRAGQSSEPIRSGSTLVVLVACARDEPPSGLPSKSDIEETLLRQRLELLSRRYLRDLRRQANVEIRG